jgi:hypothetical protein
VALKLAKAGYWNGDPEQVLRAPLDMVLSAAEYEGFCSDYEVAFLEMSKKQAQAGSSPW